MVAVAAYYVTMWDSISLLLNIPAGLLSALCFVESSHRDVVVLHDGGSPSIGICQMKLDTARIVDKKATLNELMMRQRNAELAARYLARQYKRYGCWKHAVAAYNSGRLHLHVSGLPRNNKYVRRVEKRWGHAFPACGQQVVQQ
jgi:hypothetical protein